MNFCIKENGKIFELLMKLKTACCASQNLRHNENVQHEVLQEAS